MKQGYIKAKKKEKGGPPHVLYEITPAGLENIANAKKMMKSSTERWNLMRQLFIDLMEPDDLVRFVLNSLELQIELVHTLVESDRSGLSDQDKLFILRQYRLNLERELTRAMASIKEIEGRTPSENTCHQGSSFGGEKGLSRTTLVSADRIAEGDSMIRVENLTKKFGDFVALDDISFDVKKGEIFGLLGPNGAGKSTTLRILSTLARPTKGTATIGGHDIVKDDTEVRKLIGIVSEKMIMYDRLTARENLWFFGSLFEIPSDVLTQRIDELLDLVQLTKWKNSLVGTFSTGMRQRMNVVRALLNMPQVLFLDEPTLGLDPQSSVEIREFVKKLNRENGTTIIITTHTMVDADMLCDRIAIIDHGKVVALDTSTNLKKLISGGRHHNSETGHRQSYGRPPRDHPNARLRSVRFPGELHPHPTDCTRQRRVRQRNRLGEKEGREDNVDRKPAANA